jgi:TonB family protein
MLTRSLAACLLLLAASAMAFAQTAEPPPAPPAPIAPSFGSPCAYPDAALKAGAQGTAFVSFRGMPDGTIADVVVLKSSGSADLDKATEQCVSNWRFDAKSAAGAFDLGPQKTNIQWSIPAKPADATAPPPAGRFVGRAHECRDYYPLAEFQAGIVGITTLSFTIGTDGSVSGIAVLQSSGNADLDDSAMQCARHWRYRPALQNGVPVAVPWKAQISWAIHD